MRTSRLTLTVVGLALALACAAGAQAQTRQRGFSVVLVLGDTKAGPPAENVPLAVQKALADVKDFLPYKSYKVLETQWVAGSKGATTRLHGMDDQDYDVDITADEEMGGPHQGMLNVIFKLQEVGAAAPNFGGAGPNEEMARSIAAADVEKERAEIERVLALAKASNNTSAAQQYESQRVNLTKRLALLRARRLIDSRFEMNIGETVVVGTSKLGGSDKALVVLLTAVTVNAK
jgi:hypothetical protein